MDGDAYATLRAQIVAEAEAEPAPGRPAQATTPPAEPAPEDAPADETISEADEDNAPSRIRLGGLSEKSRELTNLAVRLAKTEGIEIHEAMSRLTGRGPAAAEPAPADPAAATPAEPAPTVAALRTRIAEMREQIKAAASEADTVKMAELTLDLDDARVALGEAIGAEAQGRQALHQSQISSKDKAKALYPTVTKPTSPLYQRWNEVHARLLANHDPLLSGNNPNVPLIITQMAAAELGIAPGAPAKAAPSVPPSPSPNAVRPVQPAPGSARSSAPSNPAGQLDQRLTGITKMDDYEQLKDELFAAR